MAYRDKRHIRKDPLSTSQWVMLAAFLVIALLAGGCGLFLLAEEGFTLGAQPTYEELKEEIPPEEGPLEFHYGVYVDNISLGGLTLEEAAAKVKLAQDKLVHETSIRLYEGEEEIRLQLADCRVTFDTDEVLEQAMLIGRQGAESAQRDYIAQLPANPVKLSTHMTVDPSPLQPVCVEFARSLESEPQDAMVLGYDQGWITIADKEGRVADMETMWALVDESFGNCTFADVNIPVEKASPAVTLDSLMIDKQLIAAYTTKMSRDDNRINNIQLACRSICGTVLQPGETFSFNDVVGKRTEARGYKEAGVIMGGDRLDEGIGGGICQVSGTLYNAAVMSDMTVTKHYNHSYELSYLKRGRDSAVDYGRKDLAFTNTTDRPLLVCMYANEETLDVVAEIYGTARNDGITVDIRVETLKEPKPDGEILYEKLDTLEKGETLVVRAKNGIVCQSYKVYTQNGTVIREEPLFRDSYPPIQGKVYYSPKDSVDYAKYGGGDSVD